MLQLQEVAKPVPKDDELLIKIHATCVTSSDIIVRQFSLPRWHPMGIMMGLMLGFRRPRNPILGLVLSGEVEAVGGAVERFQTGDQVFAMTVKSPTQIRFGTYAEYICLPEDWAVAPKPSSASYEEAAAILYGGWLALHYLKKGDIGQGQKVLIVGASGAAGTSAVQIAKHFGAHVTGVCSTRNLELVKSLGADAVVDYTQEDFTQQQARYDLILDAVPAIVADRKNTKNRAQNVLTPNGKYISIDDGTPKPSVDGFIFLKELFEAGELEPVIDRCYPLAEMVEAHRYVDTGRKRGNVVIRVSP